MSSNLRWDQCCQSIIKGRCCTRPASELGGLCGACWKGLSPEARATLEWAAKWEIAEIALESKSLPPLNKRERKPISPKRFEAWIANPAKIPPLPVPKVKPEELSKAERFELYFEERAAKQLRKALDAWGDAA